MELPPQPKPEDFFLDGAFQWVAYDKATAAWKEVCLTIVKGKNE